MIFYYVLQVYLFPAAFQLKQKLMNNKDHQSIKCIPCGRIAAKFTHFIIKFCEHMSPGHLRMFH